MPEMLQSPKCAVTDGLDDYDETFKSEELSASDEGLN
jgi:hypothetical protein